MVGLERGTVELAADHSSWRAAYETEVERLHELTASVRSFEHVGSTAIPGVPAKPVVDMLAVVDDGAVAETIATLEVNGYQRRPNDDVPDRVFLVKGPPEERTHYLSLVDRDSDCYREQVGFRDYLHENPAVADEYAALKRALANRYSDNRAAYTAEKSAFVERVLRDALD